MPFTRSLAWFRSLSSSVLVRRRGRTFGCCAVASEWRRRRVTSGWRGMRNGPCRAGGESRRPHRSPCRSEPGVEAAVLAVRAQHPAWGRRKIRARLLQAGAEMAPAPSTITAILRRHGEPVGAHGGGRADWTRFEQPRPNALWQMDHKGHVAMADGRRLHPLTVLDDHSRYALVLKPARTSAPAASARRWSRPSAAMGCRRRSSPTMAPWGNGPASPSPARRLPDRPGHPHRPCEALSSPDHGQGRALPPHLEARGHGRPALRRRPCGPEGLERWRAIYNHERPHEALDLRPPASRYQPSPRSYRETPEPIDYAPQDQVRTVQDGGRISFKGLTRRVPHAFKGRPVALRPSQADGCYDVFYRHQKIATLDFSNQQRQPQPVHHVSEQVSTISPV